MKEKKRLPTCRLSVTATPKQTPTRLTTPAILTAWTKLRKISIFAFRIEVSYGFSVSREIEVNLVMIVSTDFD